MKKLLLLFVAVLVMGLCSYLQVLGATDLALLAAVGVATGGLAGLFGLGGGTIMVPGLVYVLGQLQVPLEMQMHIALATSLAVIVPTSLSVMRAQMARGAVDIGYVKRLGPCLAIGAFAGAGLASLISAHSLMLGFSLFLGFVGLNVIVSGLRQQVAKPKLRHPPLWLQIMLGLLVGVISALLGIGGGVLLVPVLMIFGLAMHVAVGSSSAMGSIIALPGALGYIVSGWSVAGRPEYALGYIWLVGVFVLAPLAMLAAPYGVKLSHHLPVKWLKISFALFLLFTAGKMFMKSLG